MSEIEFNKLALEVCFHILYKLLNCMITMKKASSIILFTLLVIALVAIVVFSQGNSPSTSSVFNSSNSTIISGNTQNSSGNDAINASNAGNLKITLEELAQHSAKGNCWIAFEGKIYDITSWLPIHPGSSAAIEPFCGTSGEFEKAFTDKHGRSQI